jgi:hypothetical protein
VLHNTATAGPHPPPPNALARPTAMAVEREAATSGSWKRIQQAELQADMLATEAALQLLI